MFFFRRLPNRIRPGTTVARATLERIPRMILQEVNSEEALLGEDCNTVATVPAVASQTDGVPSIPALE